MAIVVEYLGAGWTNITSYIPFLGDSDQGIVPFSLETVRESNIAILRFGMDASSVAVNCGVEIRAVVDGTVRFGGYITTREQRRWGAANEKLSINYECQDYNSILDRIIVPSYTIDAGDTDSTEIETLRATYLNAIGVTAGTISTIDAAMPELKLSGTFRQCMEAICGAVGGALFYISPLKALYYGVGVWGTAGAENLSDDLTVAFSHPYTDFVFRDDESRRVNAVYIIGEGIEGWYPDPPAGAYYQKLIVDPSITTQDGLDSLGAAIVSDFGSALEEYSLTQWSTDVWEYDYVTLRHSDLVVGTPSLWVRRAVARARSSDTSELEFDMELGDHTVESNYLGPSPISGGSGMVSHTLLSSPYHSDADEYTVTRGALIVGDSTPEWNGLAHPAAANRYIQANAADPSWVANITLDNGAWIGAGAAAGRLQWNTGPAPDVIWVGDANFDLDGNDLVIDADGDSYLHASADDVIDFVLATASGELGITINGAQDFSFTANVLTVEEGSSIHLSQYIYHLGDGDTFISFSDDAILFTAGGAGLLTLTEAATDSILCGALLDLNNNDLLIDTDGDSYLHASADDVVSLAIANNEQYDWDATEMTFSKTDGTEILWIRTHGDVTATGADIYANERLGLAADNDVGIFIDANASGTGAYFAIFNNGETFVANELMRVTEAPVVFVNETTNAFTTIGMTLQQGGNDDEILAVKSSDVSHGITTLAEADTYGTIRKSSAARGGAQLRGYRENSSGAANWGALELVGYLDENADTTKTTSGYGIIRLNAGIENGAGGVTQVNADGNMVTIESQTVTRFIFDAEGSAHADVEWITFAEHDDLALLDGLEASFGQFADEHKRELEALGIAHFDDRPGHAMVNWTRLSMLLVGAARQMGARLDRLEGRLLEASNASA